MTIPSSSSTPAPALDPLLILKGFGSLRRLTGTYPAGHPMVVQRLKELDDAVRAHLRHQSPRTTSMRTGD